MRKQPGPSHSVVLTCCILLYTFSGLAGDSSHAEVHLSHGVQILREMIDDKQTNSSPAAEKGSLHSTKEGLDALKPVMARLDLELAQYSQGDMWLVLQDDAYDVEERQDFANVQDAALDLYRLFRMLKRLMEQVKVFVEHSVLTAPQVVVASHAQLTRAFADWRRRFSAYESKHGSIDATAQQTHRIKSKSQLLEALSVQVLKTDYLLIKQSLDSLVLDFPFTRRDRPLQPVGTESANLLSAARRALELQVAYKKACDLPMSHQGSAHWSISDTLAILSVEPETRERALALSREFSPVVAGLKTRSPTGRDDV